MLIIMCYVNFMMHPDHTFEDTSSAISLFKALVYIFPLNHMFNGNVVKGGFHLFKNMVIFHESQMTNMLKI